MLTKKAAGPDGVKAFELKHKRPEDVGSELNEMLRKRDERLTEGYIVPIQTPDKKERRSGELQINHLAELAPEATIQDNAQQNEPHNSREHEPSTTRLLSRKINGGSSHGA